MKKEAPFLVSNFPACLANERGWGGGEEMRYWRNETHTHYTRKRATRRGGRGRDIYLARDDGGGDPRGERDTKPPIRSMCLAHVPTT